MNACPDLELLISERAAGTLGPEDAARLDAHLATCAGCAAELAATERALGLARLPPVSEGERRALSGLAGDVLAAYGRSVPRLAAVPRRWAIGVAALAAVAVVALVPAFLHRGPRPPAPTEGVATASDGGAAVPDGGAAASDSGALVADSGAAASGARAGTGNGAGARVASAGAGTAVAQASWQEPDLDEIWQDTTILDVYAE